MSRTPADSIRVLHVDDDPAFAEMVAEFLKREDDTLAVTTASSANEGLVQLDETGFDCIVSDYDMPGKDGIEFLEAVRADYPDIPFILYTGKGSEEIASEAISAGVTEYMQKETGTDQYTVLANRIKNSVEQYRAEQEAERTQRRLQELTDGTTDCMWMFTSDWEELLFISGYEEIWHRPAEAIEENPQDFLDAVHPDHQKPVEQAMARVSEGESTDIEYRIRRGDGSTAWVWVKGEPIFDDDGDVVRVVGFTRDITERKEHEQELKQTTERMEFALRSTDAGIWELDPETGNISGYPTPCPIFEQEFKTVDAFFEKIHPDDRSRVRDAIETAVETGNSASMEFRTTSDVEAQWVESTTKPVEGDDGSVAVLTGLLRDVSERKEHERRLNCLHDATTELIQADSHEAIAEVAVDTFRDILDMPNNAVWLHNEGENVLEPVAITDKGRELLGEPPVFEPGENISWDAFRSQEIEVFENVTSHPDRHNPETPIRSEIILPLGDHGVLNIGSTDPEEFDETDVSLARILASNVEAALNRADGFQELDQQRERLDEFASVVSHDLRSPLNVANGYLELAQAECDSEHLDEVADAHERMQTLIDNLLTLAREGESVSETEAINLEEIADTCWGTVETGEATLITDTEQTIRADRARLQQLLENLFRNAIEHGGRTVRLRVGKLEDGFFVEDDGPGIPPEQRDDVLEMGYSTTDTGTGFGLSIVTRIADAHSWDTTITEGSEGGARIEFTGVSILD